MYLDEAKKLFDAERLATADEIQPCTQAEIAALQEQVGRLPATYKEFLFWMGHGAGQFLRGTDAFYQNLAGQHEGALELLAENHFEEPLPKDAFVFYMHQGYQIMFFHLGEDEDPPIYFFGEGTDQHAFVELYASFSAFMMTEIAGHARVRDQLEEPAKKGRTWGYFRFTDPFNNVNENKE